MRPGSGKLLTTGCGVGCIPGTFWTVKKKFQLFPGGASPPPDPPSSRLLSQPPQDRFEHLSQVGRCRGLHGGKYLVNGLVDHRIARSSPSKPADSGTFSGPHSRFFSASFSSHFQETPQIMSTPLTQRRECQVWVLSTLFVEFPGNATNFVGSAGSTLFVEFSGNAAKNKQKKVPEWGPENSSGICRPGWG